MQLSFKGVMFRALVCCASALVLCLGALSPARAAAPPAGTVIDNQARGTYVDANGVTRTVSSNLVTTTVQQVKSFRLDQPGSASGAPGQRVFLPHVLTNTGNGTDTYTFIVPSVTAGTAGVTNLGYFADVDNDGQPDVGAPNLAGTTVSLTAGQQLRFVLSATIPMAATPGSSSTVRVSASDTQPTTRVNDDVITVVSAQAGVTKRIRDATGAMDVAAVPPLTTTVLRVVLEYTTSGSVPVTNLTIEDALPAGFNYRGNARWNGQPLGDAPGSGDDPMGIAYEFNAAGRTARAVIATVPLGGSGSIAFDIEASNQLAPTDISLLGSAQCGAPAINSRCPELTRNTGRFTFTPQGGSPQPNANTNTVQVIVTQRAGVVANDGSSPPVVGMNDIVSQASAPPNGVVRFDDFIYNTGNFNDSFRVSLLNAGSCSHTATGANACTFPAGTTFVIYGADGVTPLSNDTTPVVPPFNGNAANRTRVVVEARLPTPSQLAAVGINPAQLPNTNGGNGYRITLQAQSITTPPVTNAGATDPVVNVLGAIIASRADLTLNTPRSDSMPPGSANASNANTTGFDATGTTILNQASPPTVTPRINQPTTVVFPLYVNNTAAVPDDFVLSGSLIAANALGLPSGSPPALPPGWTLTFAAPVGTCGTTGAAITNSGTVPAGGNRLVCAVVTLPATSTMGSFTGTGNYDFQFTIAGVSTASGDTVATRVVVTNTRNLVLAMDQSGSVQAGGSITYTHTLTNNGTQPETITFPNVLADSRPGWTSTAVLESNNQVGLQPTDSVIGPATTFSLAPGGSRVIYVTVTAPANATSQDPANATRVSVVGTVATVPVTVANTDTTSIPAPANCAGILLGNELLRPRPGETVFFPHSIRNTGQCDTDFTISTSDLPGDFQFTNLAFFPDVDGDGRPDSAVPITRTPVLRPGEEFRFVLQAGIPQTAMRDQFDDVRVNAVLNRTMRPIDPRVDRAVVFGEIPQQPPPPMTLRKSMTPDEGASPAGPIVVELVLTNPFAGNTTKTNVVLTDTLPRGLTYVAGSATLARDAGTPQPLTDAAGGDPLGADFSFTAGALRLAFASFADGVARLRFSVNVDAGLPLGTVLENIGTVTYQDVLGRTPSTTSNITTYRVTERVALTFIGQDIPNANPGDTLNFNNVLTNLGNATDTFEISLGANNFPAGTTIELYRADGRTRVADTNGNGGIDSGPLGAGESTSIIARVTLPQLITGGMFRLDKNAVSTRNSGVRDTAVDTLGVINRFCRTVMEPDNAASVVPGESVVYRHTITNRGNCTETITFPTNFLSHDRNWVAVLVIDNPAASDASAPGIIDAGDTVVRPGTTFELAPGQRVVLLHRVTSPADATNGTIDVGTLTANASASGELRNRDTTTVAANTGVINTINNYTTPQYRFPSIWVYIGTTANLRAFAASCNQNPGVAETRRIIITGPGGEREEFNAVETGPNTGIFDVAPIPVRAPPARPSNQILEGVRFDTFGVELVGCGRPIETTISLLDPTAVVFDSGTNQPVEGATVTLVRASAARAASEEACEGTAVTLERIEVGGVAVRSTARAVTGADGRFTFVGIPPGSYCLKVEPPNGYRWVSQVPISRLSSFNRFLDENGSYGRTFTIGPMEAPVLVDIPVDPAPLTGLFIQKQALQQQVELGGHVDYVLRIRNSSGRALDQADVFLTDALPAGFTFVAGTARIRREGVATNMPDPQGSPGPRLTFNVGRFANNQEVELNYRLRVGAGALEGDGINRAFAIYRSQTVSATSNTAIARVTVTPGVFTMKGVILGKVFMDCDGDGVQNREGKSPKEVGIPGVRLYLEDGTSIITDSEGKYSIYGVSSRNHVIKLDKTTLPPGSQLSTLANRQGLDASSRFVDLKLGELFRADFAVSNCTAQIASEVDKRRRNTTAQLGETERTLKSTFDADAQTRRPTDQRALPSSGVVGETIPQPQTIAGQSSIVGSVVPQTGGATLGPGAAPPSAGQGAASTTPAPALSFAPVATVDPEPSVRNALPAERRVPPLGLESALIDVDNKLAFVGLKDGDVLPYAQTVVRVKGSAGSTFTLTVNGVVVADSRVGKKAKIDGRQVEGWEFFGIDLKPGKNSLVVAQKDAFGNPRGQESITVTAPDKPARLNVLLPQVNGVSGAIADGLTPAVITLEVRDAAGVLVNGSVPVTLEASRGKWEEVDLDKSEPGVQVMVTGGRALVKLTPPSEPGEARIRVSSGPMVGEARLDLLPELRQMIAVGLVEGVINLRNINPKDLLPVRVTDGFEEELSHWSRNWDNGKATAAARAAFFLKGKIQGKYLITASYDSDKNTRERLFRDIQPDEFYPVYGDSSVRQFDAQSTGRFYVRIDRDKSYLLYGDYQTTTSSEGRKLSNYQRSLTGGKFHFENAYASVNVFASRDTTRQVVEELRANGTSGPYILGNVRGLTNSERVEIIVRDRNQPSIILRTAAQSRFVDYEIEPLAGRIIFRAPVPSLDAELNPIYIRVTYEVDQGGTDFWVAGVDGQFKVHERLEIGGVYVRDRNPLDPFTLAGANAIAKVAEGTFVIGEYAQTERPLKGGKGDAARIELRHKSESFEASVYTGKSDVNFDNAGSLLNSGRAETGAKAALRMDTNTTLKLEGLRSEDRGTNGGVRDGLLASVEYAITPMLKLELGIRYAKDSAGTVVTSPENGASNNVPNEVTTVRARVTGRVPQVENANVYAEAEVDTQDTDKKILAVGGEYTLPNKGRLYGRHEFVSSVTGPYGLTTSQRQNASVIGLDTEYMKDGRLFSEYRVRDAFSGGDAEAAIGLRNLWTLTEGVRMSTSFERVHAIAGKGESEATAGGIGIEYTANPLWKASGRFELRDGKTSDSMLATLGLARKLERDWTFLGRASTATTRTDVRAGDATTKGERSFNRVQVGIAYRDTIDNVWSGLGRIEHREERDDSQAGVQLKRSVNLVSVHGNYQPSRPFLVTARYAAKWVNDKTNGLDTKGTSQLIAGRATYDLSKRWDVGVHAGVIFSNGTSTRQHTAGVEVGYMLTTNLWLSAGYNWTGYRDEELSFGNYTVKGPYVRLRYKFDEDLMQRWQGDDGKRISAAPAQSGSQAAAATTATAP